MTTIGLAMIAKDEAPNITRALDSARSLIDYALITDTGSTDGTQDIALDWLKKNNVAGHVISVPWQNFGHNRTRALDEMRSIQDMDYAFMLDADEIVQIHDPKIKEQQLTADCYHIDIHWGSIIYPTARLTHNKLPFYYRGPAHEWLDCKDYSNFTKATLDGISIISSPRGTSDRYAREAELFEQELQRENLEPRERTRYTFYLAQSYRDSRQHDKALLAYFKRVELGGWLEEVYISLLNAGRLQQILKASALDVIKTFERAVALNPKRAEAIYEAARALRQIGLHHEAYHVAEQGIRLPLYRGLFVETWIYQRGLLDEFAVSAYWAGHHTRSWLATQMLLRDPNLPEFDRKRIEQNAEFARN